MDDPLFSCRLDQTEIQIIKGDLTQTAADALVSSDDVYLTKSGGISLAISQAAGEALNEDMRKFEIPVRLGRVVVTNAGRLPAKYVFHATTLDFATEPPMPALIAHLVRRILEIGAALEVKHIALPLLGTGTAGFTPAEGLRCIFQAAAYHIVSKTLKHVEKLTIVIFGSADVKASITAIEENVEQAEKIQQRIAQFQSICTELTDDEELTSILSKRIVDSKQTLRQCFHFDLMDEAETFRPPRDAVSYEGYREAQKRLNDALAELRDKKDANQKLLRLNRRRLQKLREEQAMKGISVDAETLIDIENTEQQIAELEYELEQIKNQRSVYQQELAALHY